MQPFCPNFCSEVSILLEILLIQSGGALLQMEWRTIESVILCNLAKSNDILYLDYILFHPFHVFMLWLIEIHAFTRSVSVKILA